MQLMKWQDLIWYAFLNLIWYVMKEKLSKMFGFFFFFFLGASSKMLVGDMVCYFQKTFQKKKSVYLIKLGFVGSKDLGAPAHFE